MDLRLKKPDSGPQYEFRVIGPPGCGKTTWLGLQVGEAVEHGQSVLVASLTRAAAMELVSRSLPIPPEYTGTLHSHCFRALGYPRIAQSGDALEEWNLRYPYYAMTPAGQDASEFPKVGSREADRLKPGDILLSQHDKYRSTRTLDRMPQRVRVFAKCWERWKREHNVVDFTDLIELCLQEVGRASGHPNVLLIDEAQDLSPLELMLVRKWATLADSLFLVGDPDQAIFGWRGADPSVFMNPVLPQDQQLVLEQSYRMPRRIHNLSVRWIDRVAGRDPINYLPREVDGRVGTNRSTPRRPEAAIEDAEKHMAAGRTVMFLAACRYMLVPLMQALKGQGIPFHNPFRPTFSPWNPLGGLGTPLSIADRIAAFLRLSWGGAWSASDVRAWVPLVNPQDMPSRSETAQAY